MTPPEARELAAEARALAEKFDAFWPSHHAPSDGLGAYLGDGIHACVRSKHVADALRSLADQVERQAQALTILDGFKGPPPNKDQWDGICALAQALKEVIAREAT